MYTSLLEQVASVECSGFFFVFFFFLTLLLRVNWRVANQCFNVHIATYWTGVCTNGGGGLQKRNIYKIYKYEIYKKYRSVSSHFNPLISFDLSPALSSLFKLPSCTASLILSRISLCVFIKIQSMFSVFQYITPLTQI